MVGGRIRNGWVTVDHPLVKNYVCLIRKVHTSPKTISHYPRLYPYEEHVKWSMNANLPIQRNLSLHLYWQFIKRKECQLKPATCPPGPQPCALSIHPLCMRKQAPWPCVNSWPQLCTFSSRSDETRQEKTLDEIRSCCQLSLFRRHCIRHTSAWSLTLNLCTRWEFLVVTYVGPIGRIELRV
jgi:hypothetical protein